MSSNIIDKLSRGQELNRDDALELLDSISKEIRDLQYANLEMEFDSVNPPVR